MSPDGRRLLLSVSLGGPAAIYAFDLDTEKTTQVTSKENVALNPCWLTNDEFPWVIFRDKEKGDMWSVYRISVGDKSAKLVIKSRSNPSVSAP